MDLINKFQYFQIRRFLKSLRKFPSPLNRLDSIAIDAELTEKPLSDLEVLANHIIDKCKQALEQKDENPNANGMVIYHLWYISSKQKPAPTFRIVFWRISKKQVILVFNKMTVVIKKLLNIHGI